MNRDGSTETREGLANAAASQGWPTASLSRAQFLKALASVAPFLPAIGLRSGNASNLPGDQTTAPAPPLDHQAIIEWARVELRTEEALRLKLD